MSRKKSDEETAAPDLQRRARRASILLILAVAALVAAGLWFFNAWFSGHSRAGRQSSAEQPVPPALGQDGPPAGRDDSGKR